MPRNRKDRPESPALDLEISTKPISQMTAEEYVEAVKKSTAELEKQGNGRKRNRRPAAGR
jgi:hypothetical protein